MGNFTWVCQCDHTVCQLYPGSDVEQCWLIADMDRLVEETLKTGTSSLTDLGKYYRDFITITTFLIMKNCLATPEQSCAFTWGFPPELWSQVSNQLQLKFPDHFPNDPYTLEEIHGAMCFVHHGTTDESTHQILSYGLLFSTFYNFPATADPPTCTTPMWPSVTFMNLHVITIDYTLYPLHHWPGTSHMTYGPCCYIFLS